jgi:hypothetical protein
MKPLSKHAEQLIVVASSMRVQKLICTNRIQKSHHYLRDESEGD